MLSRMRKIQKVSQETVSVRSRQFKEMANASKIKNIMKKVIWFFILAGFFAGVRPSLADEASSSAVSHKGPHVTVDSTELEPFSLNEKTEPKNERAVFYSDEKASVDINDEGEPNLNMHF